MKNSTSHNTHNMMSRSSWQDRISIYSPKPIRDNINNKSSDCSISLQNVCMKVIIQNFDNLVAAIINGNLPRQYQHEILQSLSIDDFDNSLGAMFIMQDDFWKNVSLVKFGESLCDLNNHGLVWKRLYFESYLQHMINELTQSKFELDKDKILNIIKSIQDNIFNIELVISCDGISLDEIFANLPNVYSMKIEYTAPKFQEMIGDQIYSNSTNNEAKKRVGMQQSDCIVLSRALQVLPNLCSLTLSNSQIDDEKVRLIIQMGCCDKSRISLRDTLIHLDLSHNKISTDGLKLLLNHFFDGSSNEQDENDNTVQLVPHEGQMFNDDNECINTDVSKSKEEKKPILVSFNISNNCINACGGDAIGKILQESESLIHLNLGFNSLGDDGGVMLLQGLKYNRTLQSLSVEANRLSGNSALVLYDLLRVRDSNPLSGNNENYCSKSDDGEDYSFGINHLERYCVDLSKELSQINLDYVNISANDFSEDDEELLRKLVNHGRNIVL